MPSAARLRACLGDVLAACLRRGWLTGLTAALALILIGAGGGLHWLERPLYDATWRWFGQPTESVQPGRGQVAYFEIDDATLANTGRWPWPRAWLADAVRELDRAGASVIALDLLLDEAQETRYLAGPDPAAPLAAVHDDALLAEALRGNAKTLLAARVAPAPHWSEAERWMLAQLCREPLLTGESLALRAKEARLSVQSALQGLPSLKREALRIRVRAWRAEHGRGAKLEDCRRDLLGQPEGFLHVRLETQLLDDAWNLQEALGSAERSWPAVAEPGEATRLIPPILPLAQAARAVGGAPWSPDSDGVVRSCLLATPCENGMAPTLPVMAACLHLGLAPEKMRREGDAWVLPRPGAADIRIPLLIPRMGEGWEVPGPRALVAWSERGAGRQPVGPLIELARLDDEIRRNEQMADIALMQVATAPQWALPADLLARFDAMLEWTKTDPAAADGADFACDRAQLREEMAQALKRAGVPLNADAKKTPDKESAIPLAAWRAATGQAQAGRLAVGRLRNQLRLACHGKVCLMGWTATGSLADFVTTPLGARVPGMYVQGATIETVLAGDFITRAPLWAEMLLAAGLAAWLCFAAWRRSLPFSVAALAVSMVAVFLIAGKGALDLGHLRVDTALPLSAGMAGWATCMLTRSALEQKQKRRITAQFRNYVSPSLVDHLVAHPELVSMHAHKRELTCVFTDFAGFTTVSLALDPERTARLLNRYLAAATRAFMDSGGNVNKFMGDGILVFWGAPVADPEHALSACRGLLACHRALAALTRDPELADLPALTLRAGAITGPMMVGDFGAPPERSDYTVIGDGANLASRLESANKQLGTTLLVGAKTAVMAHDQMLLRPIARLRVVGRNTPESVFELLAEKDRATLVQVAAAERSSAALTAFFNGRFAECLSLLDAAEIHEPGAGWITLHRAACLKLRAAPDPAFDGSIQLGSK